MYETQNNISLPDSAVVTNPAIIELRTICKSYAKPSGEPIPVLVDIGLTIHEGEIVGLLGRLARESRLFFERWGG
jgi:NitT/TauT family transport system ATP-binding protein